MRRLLFSMGTLILVAGCNLIPTEPYIKTNYFDLGYPAEDRVVPGGGLVIREFRASEPYATKMVFRNSPNHLSFDEYNRWSMDPADMLKRYFILAYDSRDVEVEDRERLELEGDILQFEGDLATGEVNLILRLTVRDAKSDDIVVEDVFRRDVAVDEMTANQFARGMKRAVDDMISQLDQRLRSETGRHED